MLVLEEVAVGSRCRFLTIPWVLAAMLALPGRAPAQEGDTPVVVVHAGVLLAVPGEPPRSKQSIVIRDGKIAEIRDGFVDAATVGADEVVDLSGRFVLPGLLDMHTHLTGELGPDAKLQQVEMSDVDVAFQAAVHARRTLEAGFTTVRNLGGNPEAIFGLRDAIAGGKVPGPRIVAAGNAISGTGGHADTHGFREEILELFASPGICDGADDCRRAVRQLVKSGSDVIKITATGGVLSNVASGTGQQLFDDEMASIVATAHLLGRKVAAHAHQAGGINAALRAGVDSIDHGTLSDEESFRLFQETGAYLVPTLLAGHTVNRMLATSDFLPPATRAKAADLLEAMAANAGRAHAAGVRIAFGTDSGVSRHGTNAAEFALMVASGIPAADCIVAATVHAADLIGLADEIGTLEPGKQADLIAVSGDPLQEITVLERVEFVMRGGTIFLQR